MQELEFFVWHTFLEIYFLFFIFFGLDSFYWIWSPNWQIDLALASFVLNFFFFVLGIDLYLCKISCVHKIDHLFGGKWFFFFFWHVIELSK